jgi:tRNA pseudouridine38-40 synthase
VPQRFFIRLSYKGTHYNGWQIQPGVKTIQETLNKALSVLLKSEIYTIGAGRTDTGVHAHDYIAHFDYDKDIPEIDKAKIIYHVNCILPTDIVLHDIYRVIPDAHARFSALSRTYCYRLSRVKNPFTSDVTWYYSKPLNIAEMNNAANVLFDYFDFTSFSKLHTDVKTNNCVIKKALWVEEGDELVFYIQADRFLRNMVRAIVGTLLKVGAQQLSLQGFREVIEKRDRQVAGMSVDAKGLHLIEIEYPENIIIP